jgi:hypothetical protein
MPTKNPKTEKIRRRFEQLKAAARPAEPQDVDAPVDVPLTESDVKAEIGKAKAVEAEVGDAEKEYALDGAAKFVWMIDGKQLEGQYRLNDTTITVRDPITGYTASTPISLALAVQVTGIGRLVHADLQPIQIPGKFKLRSGEFVASMAISISLPRVVWRIAQRSIVWAVVQFQPMKSEWRILRLRSVPRQTVYEAQQILHNILGDNVYTKLRESIQLLAEPL